jgi:chromodomain-helicase-DNA-binding protein 4
VLLCSYETLKTEIKLLLKIEWQILAIDEGQRLKNNASKMFKMSSAIRARFRMLLSGTPLQNNFDELYNLLEFLDPLKFNAKFRKDME